MSLQDYIIDTSALLHDQNQLFTSSFTLTRWINEARDQVAMDTGCLRVLAAGQAPFGTGAQPGSAVPGGAVPAQPPFNGFYTIPSQEKYPYQFANEYVTSQNRGIRGVGDVVGVAVSWGGAIRPMMVWMPWDELQAFARSYNVGVFSWPMAWSNYGSGENGQIWLWPAPSAIAEMEWDSLCLPCPLQTNDDYEAIPKTYQRGVKFYAASLAYEASNREARAATMKQRYYDAVGTAAGASERMRIRDYYVDWTSW
jgi:hypothetical protein